MMTSTEEIFFLQAKLKEHQDLNDRLILMLDEKNLDEQLLITTIDEAKTHLDNNQYTEARIVLARVLKKARLAKISNK